MRFRAALPLLVASCLPPCSFAACSGGQVGPPAVDAGGGDAAMQPQTATCSGAATQCLSGTLATKGMTAQLQLAGANLFRVFPYGAAKPIAAQLVAKDGTWAFSNLDPWAHYFVQLNAGFSTMETPIAVVVGPLTVPSTGAPVAALVKPVQLEAYQARQQGGQSALAWVSAHVFDPTTGAELGQGANVAVVVGGSPTALTYGTDANGKGRYYVQFPTPVPAAASYQVTVSHPSFGASPVTFQLVPDQPNFDVTLTAPASGATVPVMKDIAVSWPAQPVDYELLELFTKSSGGYTAVYSSPAPDAPDTTSDAIPGANVAAAGMYLVNVAFAKASCPATADGCVYGNTVASAQLTAQ